MKKLEFKIPEGYVKSLESTDAKLVYVCDSSAKTEKFFLEIFNKLKIRIEPEDPDSVYFDIGEVTYFEQDFKNSILWVSYWKIWTVLRDNYSLKHDEAQMIIESMVEKHLKWKGLTPHVIHHIHRRRVEKHLKWKGLTPPPHCIAGN